VNSIRILIGLFGSVKLVVRNVVTNKNLEILYDHIWKSEQGNLFPTMISETLAPDLGKEHTMLSCGSTGKGISSMKANSLNYSNLTHLA
jgi:hypothetical protein